MYFVGVLFGASGVSWCVFWVSWCILLVYVGRLSWCILVCVFGFLVYVVGVCWGFLGVLSWCNTLRNVGFLGVLFGGLARFLGVLFGAAVAQFGVCVLGVLVRVQRYAISCFLGSPKVPFPMGVQIKS